MTKKCTATAKFTVVPWRDYHGVAWAFLVVTPNGKQCRTCPSEHEAEAVAADLQAKLEEGLL
jgi:hypothetical protein